MMDIPAPTLFGLSLGGETRFYYVCLVVAAGVFLGLDRITHLALRMRTHRDVAG